MDVNQCPIGGGIVLEKMCHIECLDPSLALKGLIRTRVIMASATLSVGTQDAFVNSLNLSQYVFFNLPPRSLFSREHRISCKHVVPNSSVHVCFGPQQKYSAKNLKIEKVQDLLCSQLCKIIAIFQPTQTVIVFFPSYTILKVKVRVYFRLW